MNLARFAHLFAGYLAIFCSQLCAAEPSAKDFEFFEKQIRPMLVAHCYECHSASAKKVQGGLLLDTQAGIRKGGDSGPAVAPHEVDESLLISALKFDDFEMPPKGKLPGEVVGHFEKWIELGAPDPRDGPALTNVATIDIEKGREHWAYRPLVAHAIPDVDDKSWPRNSIDRFILSNLEQNGLRPSPDAQPVELVRRVYFDLIGLPPTPQQIDAYLQSAIRNPHSAFENLVDRLFASPRFGERWGRHWLDVVRFGESNTLRGTVFSPAWRYRDYVIDTMNDDVPFDQFAVEQIAGDLLKSNDWQQRRRQLIATTMLAIGNSNFENQDKGQLRMDVVDEQLEVIVRAFLGQTIGCARCHDHKFDPIPTKDYYALAGILRNTKTLEHANVSWWLEVPLPASPAQEQQRRYHTNKVIKLASRIRALKNQLGITAKAKTGPKAVSINSLPGIVIDDAMAMLQGAWTKSTSNPRYVGSNYIHDAGESKGQKYVIFATRLPAGEYEVRVAYSAGTNRSRNTPITVWHADGETTKQIDQRKTPPIDGAFISLGKFKFTVDEPARVVVSNQGTMDVVIADAVQFLGQKQPAAVANQPGEKDKPDDKTTQQEIAEAQSELETLEEELKSLTAAAPASEKTMSVVEEKEIGNTQIHVRGNVHNLGAEVPRGFLQVISYHSPGRFTFDNKSSGRRQLGEWLVDEANPLTARVTVNRLWHWLFGVGLVRTTDNLGSVGELPSHPELLDYLALQFKRDGWSVKSMLRRMVLSRTYRMTSRAAKPRFASQSQFKPNFDVENRLLWRTNRKRLEAEAIRDAMLAIGNDLDLTMHGQTYPASKKADYDYEYRGNRRSVYLPVFRNSLPKLFEVFDFADPSVAVGRRSTSTVAPQALFMMNNRDVIYWAESVVHRIWEKYPRESPAFKIHHAYRLTLGRPPTNTEFDLALKHIYLDDPEEAFEAWKELTQTLFASLDFRYVD